VHSVLRQPVKVVVGEKNAAADTVEQSLVVCGREDGKLVALRQMVREGLRPPVLIFMQSVERAMQLFHALVYGGLHVDVLHAERTAAQRTAAQREATVSKFRAGQVLPGRRLDADWMLKLKLMARTSAGGARGGAHCAQADRTAPAAAARRRTTLRRPTRARPGTATEAHGSTRRTGSATEGHESRHSETSRTQARVSVGARGRCV